MFSKKDLKDAQVEPDVLMAVPAYKALCEEAEVEGEKGDKKGEVGEGMNDAADCNC